MRKVELNIYFYEVIWICRLPSSNYNLPARVQLKTVVTLIKIEIVNKVLEHF